MNHPVEGVCPVNVDHNDPEFVIDPFTTYHALQQRDPVHHSDAYGGYYLLTRYEDVRKALFDWETFSSGVPGATTIPMSVNRSFPEIPLEVDPPRHRPYRDVVSDWFSLRRVNTLEGRLRKIAEELLDKIDPARQVDLVHEFAVPFISRGLAVFLNVPEEESEPWPEWMEGIFHGRMTNREHADAAGRLLAGYIEAKVAIAKATGGGEDFFGMLVGSEYDGRPLTDEEIMGYSVLTLTAGQETTVNGIGSSLWCLGTESVERARLRSDPSKIKLAIEEILRHSSPIQMLGRTTARDTEIAGIQIPCGSRVALSYGAANRDPATFDSPDECDFARLRNRHIAFGAGPHACMGVHLARLEIRIAIEQILERWPEYVIVTDEVVMTPHGDLRGPWRLPARLDGGQS